VLSVDNMNAKVSGRESLNGAAESGRDLLEIDVFGFNVKLRAPKPFGGCHGGSIYQSAKHIAIWKKPPNSSKQSKFPKAQYPSH
jgi:hypothetical protein